MSRVEKAESCFSSGFNCAQAVFSVFAVENGLDEEKALKIAGAFGAGMGKMSETCGAVTGAFMVIGLKYGKSKQGDDQAKERTYQLVNEFADRFKNHNQTLVCRELLRADMRTPEGFKVIKENNLFETVCPRLVKDAVAILEEILD